MISFEEALHAVLSHAARLDACDLPLHDALGVVLAADVASDVDMPPFNKSAMDGFAVVAADLATVPATLPVVQEVPAGAVPTGPIQPGQCARIMTGAPVPDGADTVVRIEDTEPGAADDQAVFLKSIEQGANICWKAEDVRVGDVVLPAGHAIRAPETALLASCGRSTVSVYRRPTVAVLSTGNEVVPIDQVPGGGQIRDANSHYVIARLQQLGIQAVALGIAPDDEAQLRDAIAKGMEHDMLILSGGVSMGDYDLVPGVLKALGTEIIFDSVAMQPGRPAVYGRCGSAAVFGLPGNPVSVLVSTELLVVPAIRAMMGMANVSPAKRTARITERAKHRPGRLAHVPGVLSEADGHWSVRPLPYHGSAHIHALSEANCLMALPVDVPV
ncbi:molybdopterin molybdotransferase MoeA, partial [bacterium]|nr:molybdopterin molybdotransferase MoeA [bacterium]